ncbi:DUF4143 domain-containing protein [Myxococcota bacterium]|nr:DUF4143 domain-containing protein [Myxococcota bacterium]
MSILRPGSDAVRRFFEAPPGHFFLFGPRGTGKSSWLSARYRDALVLNLLLPGEARRLAARPESLADVLAGQAGVRDVVIDEVQRVPALLSVVHHLMESSPGPRFILTGSSARKLRAAGVDLLAGRAVVRRLHPFMAAELGARFDLAAALTTGLVPLVWSAADTADTLSAYIDLYVREEVQMEGLVRDVGAFARFLEAVSFSHSGLLNMSAVARECEVERKTVERYVELLEDLLLSVRVPVFARRAKRDLVAHSRFFLFDAGVFRALRPRGPLDRPQEIEGAALEGLVFQHLRSWCDYRGRGDTLHFWRTRHGLEVDFVLYGESTFAAVEVKNADRVRPEDLRGLRAFGEDYPEAVRILLHRGPRRERIAGVWCLPVEEALIALTPGRRLEEAWGSEG